MSVRRSLGSIVFVIALALVGSTAQTGCEALGFTSAEVEEVGALVEVSPVRNDYLERTLELTATIDAGQSIKMVPDMPGKVKRLPVQVGDRVRKGDLLAQLDLDMASLQRDQADAAVRLAELQLEQAQTEFGRAERLHQSGSLTDQQFDQASSGLEMAQQGVAQAAAVKGLAGTQINGGILRAPFDGVVTSVGCEQGEYFNPMGMSAAGSPVLVSLVNLDTIRLDLQVADTDVSRLAEGMDVRIFVDTLADLLPADGIQGTVEYIGLAADPMTRTFPVRVTADNPGQAVRAGMHARVYMVLQRLDQVLSVPTAAIRESAGEYYVMVAEGDVARKITIERGLEGDQGTEIKSGLAGSEQVIVKGNFGLPDGAKIEVEQ